MGRSDQQAEKAIVLYWKIGHPCNGKAWLKDFFTHIGSATTIGFWPFNDPVITRI